MFSDDLNTYINIEKKFVWIKSELEYEVMPLILDTLRKNNYEEILSFSGVTGLTKVSIVDNNVQYKVVNERPALSVVKEKFDEVQKQSISKNTAFILKDIDSQFNNPNIVRMLREFFEIKHEKYIPIILLSSTYEDIPGLSHQVALLDYDILTEDDIKLFLKCYCDIKQRDIDYENVAKEFIGFNRQEIFEILNLSFYKYDAFNIEFIKQKRIEQLKKSNVLEIIEPKLIMDDIGGNEKFKEWYAEQKICMQPEAREYGVDLPKGYLALGIPGCGKSALAQAIANDMNIPLLELKMSNILSKFVGESERQMKQAQMLIESCAPCVLLIDEVEKALGGYKSSNASDSGTLARVFGNVLQMLNDNNKGIFTIMTSNNVKDLPPELTRAGRLDGIFYFSTPSLNERREIFKVHLNKKHVSLSDDIIDNIAKKTKDYTGAEIEQIVKSSMKKAFLRHAKNNTPFELTEDDLIKAKEDIIPVYKSSKEQIEELETWVKGRALYAGKKEKTVHAMKNSKIKDAANLIK